MLKQIKHIVAVLFCVSLFSNISINAKEQWSLQNQSPEIREILNNEKNTSKKSDLVNIVRKADEIYGDIYTSIQKGQKLTIFFDPAHGKMKNGQWQGGAATRRQSCTDKPEEYYSIIFSREMYKRLKSNPYIDVKTTPDFFEVLEGRSEVYNDIPFTKTVELAAKYNAFMIISQHLNNVSVMEKADGMINIPGIHVTRSLAGQKMLRYISRSHKGFLTLYNKFDTSGFSRLYSQKLRDSLAAKGLTANSWGQGVVGDDRFTYFLDYPISVIYESGFISNPEEEKLLATKEYAEKITDSQYTTLLETIKDVFGVDISRKARKVSPKHRVSDTVDMIKLGRIAVYYLKSADTRGLMLSIQTINKKAGKKFAADAAHFNAIKSKIEQSERLYNIGRNTKNVKNTKNTKNVKNTKNTKNTKNVKNTKSNKKPRPASHYYRQAYNTLSHAPAYRAYKNKYFAALGRNRNTQVASSSSRSNTVTARPPGRSFVYPQKAPKLRTIILAIEPGQPLETAIEMALSPDTETLKKLTASFRKAAKFDRGIYLISINDKLEVTKTKKVSGVLLDPLKYQNQQYLKNSYFASTSRGKSL
ncbi:MAG: N-acetylmuramoyl-L-alanine amidase [Leptospirales bacterium]|nr:N-acetylmuramoyl-L-alanine amidase [Leptospirales bacterium]